MSSHGSDAQAIVEVATAAAGPSELDPDKRYAIVDPTGGVQIIEPADDKHRLVPRRLAGTTAVDDVDSFKVLWDKYSQPFSEVYADTRRRKITAVLNADEGGGGGGSPLFRDHRLEVDCRLTAGWRAWAAYDGKLVAQQEFAEHIEDRVLDIVEPSGADMLELAQSFEASVTADFKQVTQLSGGARALQFAETVAAKAGQQGQIEIPATFVIAVQPFEGGPAYRVTARFRYRIRNGNLSIGYKLERPEDVLSAAFEEVRDKVTEAVGRPVLMGVPPDSLSL